MNEQNEAWRPIPGYEGMYEASDQGRIRGLDRVVKRNKTVDHFVPGRVMKTRPTGGRDKQYLALSLCKDGKVTAFYAHRVIALAFLGECPDGYEVNHKDGNHRNNNLSNLEYVTRAENVRHSRDVLGTLKYTPRDMPSGEDSSSSKLTNDEVREIREMYQRGGVSYAQIAELFCVSGGQIGRIVRRERWSKLF